MNNCYAPQQIPKNKCWVENERTIIKRTVGLEGQIKQIFWNLISYDWEWWYRCLYYLVGVRFRRGTYQFSNLFWMQEEGQWLSWNFIWFFLHFNCKCYFLPRSSFSFAFSQLFPSRVLQLAFYLVDTSGSLDSNDWNNFLLRTMYM